MNFTALAGENINRKSIQLIEESTPSALVFRCVRDPQSVYKDILELLKDENRNDDQCIAHMLLLCAVCLGCKDFFHQRHLRSRLRIFFEFSCRLRLCNLWKWSSKALPRSFQIDFQRNRFISIYIETKYKSLEEFGFFWKRDFSEKAVGS